MGERTSYTPGTFSWTDLTTTDQDGAKAFYSEPVRLGGDRQPGRRRRLLLDDEARRKGRRRDLSAAPATARRRRAAGVELLHHGRERRRRARSREAARRDRPCRRVRRDGRRAGWESSRIPRASTSWSGRPRAHIGASLVNAPGAISGTSWRAPTWTGRRRSTRSCSVGRRADGGHGDDLLVIKTAAGKTNGGIRGLMPGEPPNWLVYFGVEDIEQAAAKVKELGGRRCRRPDAGGPRDDRDRARSPGRACSQRTQGSSTISAYLRPREGVIRHTGRRCVSKF